MADNVHALPGVVISEGKQTFLDSFAEAFDEKAAEGDGEPVAMMFALVTANGQVRTGYHTLGEIEHCSSLHLSRAFVCLQNDMRIWDSGGD